MSGPFISDRYFRLERCPGVGLCYLVDVATMRFETASRLAGQGGPPPIRRRRDVLNHRENLLNRRFRQVGIGLVRGSYRGQSGAQFWVAHFGYRN